MVEGGRPKGKTDEGISRRTPCGPAAPAGLPLWPESVVREEKRERRLGGKERASFGRKSRRTVRKEKRDRYSGEKGGNWTGWGA